MSFAEQTVLSLLKLCRVVQSFPSEDGLTALARAVKELIAALGDDDKMLADGALVVLRAGKSILDGVGTSRDTSNWRTTVMIYAATVKAKYEAHRDARKRRRGALVRSQYHKHPDLPLEDEEEEGELRRRGSKADRCAMKVSATEEVVDAVVTVVDIANLEERVKDMQAAMYQVDTSSERGKDEFLAMRREKAELQFKIVELRRPQAPPPLPASEWEYCPDVEARPPPADAAAVDAVVTSIFGGEEHFPGVVALANCLEALEGRRYFARRLDARRAETAADALLGSCFDVLADLVVVAVLAAERQADHVTIKILVNMGATIFTDVPGGGRTYLQQRLLNAPVQCWWDQCFWNEALMGAVRTESRKAGLEVADDVDVNLLFGQLVGFITAMLEYGVPPAEVQEAAERWLYLFPALEAAHGVPIRDHMGDLEVLGFGEAAVALADRECTVSSRREFLLANPRSDVFCVLRGCLT